MEKGNKKGAFRRLFLPGCRILHQTVAGIKLNFW